MRRLKTAVLEAVFILPIMLVTGGLMACMSGEGTEGSSGCGGSSQTQTRCGAGTKKVKDGSGYKCVPNTQ